MCMYSCILGAAAQSSNPTLKHAGLSHFTVMAQPPLLVVCSEEISQHTCTHTMKHTHTHTHIQTRTHTHTHTISLSLTHTHTHTHKHTHILSLSRTHTHT